MMKAIKIINKINFINKDFKTNKALMTFIAKKGLKLGEFKVYHFYNVYTLSYAKKGKK